MFHKMEKGQNLTQIHNICEITMESLMDIIRNMEKPELLKLSTAKFVGRKQMVTEYLIILKPKMCKPWIHKKVSEMVGFLDKPSALDSIKNELLKLFSFEGVSEIMDNFNYSATLRQRYACYYKPMIPSLTKDILLKYGKVGLCRGMPTVISESALNFYRSKVSDVSLPPSLGFYLHGRIEFPNLLKAALDLGCVSGNFHTTAIMGTRWPDIYRNWSHSVLFISDHLKKEVFILDPANEDQWEFQAKSMAKYWEKKEGIPWIVVKRVCPKQKFSGDCNVVTLMLVEMLFEGKEIPSEFSKIEIRKYKA